MTNTASAEALECECADKKCPVHHSDRNQCGQPGIEVLHRIDCDDMCGVVFCEPCAQDAMDSGVFSIHS